MNSSVASWFSPASLKKFFSPRKAPFWLVLALVLYTLIGFLVVPWVAKAQIPKIIRNHFGLEARVEEIALNPWSLTVEIAGFGIDDPDGEKLIGFDELFVNLQTSSIFNWAITLAEVSITAPYANIHRYSLDDTNVSRALSAAPGVTEDTDEPETESDGGPLRLLIHQISMKQGRVTLRDEMPETPFNTELGPVDIVVNDLSTLPDRSGQQQVSITTENGAAIDWSGSLQIAPLATSGSLAVSGELLVVAHRYLKDQLNFSIDGDHVDLNMDYELQSTPDGGIRFVANQINVKVTGIRLTEAGSGDQMLLLPMLRLENGSVRYPEQTVQVESVALDDLRIDGRIDEKGRLNFNNLLVTNDEPVQNATAQDNDDTKSEDAQPWSISLAEFQINRFSAGFEDRSLATPAKLGIANLDFRISELSNADNAVFPFESQLSLTTGGVIRQSGKLTILPEPVLDSQLEIEGLQLSIAQPYISEFVLVRIDSGELNMSANIKSDSAEQLSFRGGFTIDNLDTHDVLKNVSLLDWKQLLVDDIAVQLDAAEVEISKLKLDEPYLRFEIAEDRSTNIGDLVVERATTEPAEDSGSQEFQIQVGETDIRDGSANFADRSLPLPFAAAITNLDGDLSTISTTSSTPTNIDIKGQVDKYGSATIGGSVNPLDPFNFMDIKVVFRNLNMPTLSPYTAEFVGQKIAAGKLDIDLGYKFKEGQMLGSNSVVINDFTLGEKVENEDAMSLPLRLAVALLKDKDGVIDIDLEVSGNADDPEFNVAGVVMKALATLITKVAASPFSALGGLVGGDDVDLDILRFEAGLAELTPPDREKLVRLAEALSQRPELVLQVPPTTNAAIDRSAMQSAAVEALVDEQMSEKDESPDMFVKRQRKVLEKLYKKTVQDPDVKALRAGFTRPPTEGAKPQLDDVAYSADLRRQLAELQPVSDAQLDALAETRAGAVMDALLAASPTLENQLSQGETAQSETTDSQWIEMKLELEVLDIPATTAPDTLSEEVSR
jgi:hypothetical protein